MTEIVKAGWLMRLSTVLKRWKKSWFSLSADGYLRYFENEDKLIAEDTLFLPEKAKKVLIAAAAHTHSSHKAPEGYLNDYLIEVVAHDGTNWLICADSVDDMLAWQFALEQARVLGQLMRQLTQAPPQYVIDALASNPNNGLPMYYRGAYNGTYPSRVVQTPNGPVTIVFVDRGAYYPGHYSDYALAGLTGAALASTFMWPLWFPLWFWC